MNNKVLTVVNAGGHLTQAMCVMSVIEEFHLVTSVEIEADFGAKSTTIIKSTQFNPFIHLKNIYSAYKIIKKIKPKAIFSTGGPICIPFAIVAKVLGIRFIYLDTLSRVEELSNTAKFLYKFSLTNKMLCQWENVAQQYEGIEYYGKTFDICNDRDLSF